MARERARSQDRERSQTRGRVRTTQMREAHDDLDLDRGCRLPVGSPADRPELGAEDEMDADAQLEDGAADEPEDGGEDISLVTDITDDPVRQVTAGQEFDAGALFGARLPPIHVRLRVEGGLLRAEPLTGPDPERPVEQEAIRELTALVGHAFRPERQGIWQPLIGTEPLGAVERLLILARLALRPGDPLPLLGGGTFCPDDRELARFRRKFALFPDGIPFCVGLLLRDDRGRRKAAGKAAALASGLEEIPDPVKLIGLQRALDHECSEGVAQEDSEFGKRLRREFDAMGVPLRHNPSDEEVRTLRDRLNRLRKRLGGRCRVLFPNRRQRQQQYEQERSTGREDGL